MNDGSAGTRIEAIGDRREQPVPKRGALSWIRRRFTGSPLLLWMGNLLLLATMAAWVFFDPGLHRMLSGGEFPPAGPVTWRGGVMAGALLLAGVNLLWAAAGLWLGSTEFRRLQSLLVLTALIGLWLGCLLNLRAISWQGRRWRLRPYVAVVKEMAQPLIDHWPAEDGEAPGLGPFMAYPVGRPTTLILLTPPRLASHGPHVSAVEKSSDGALRFELSDVGGHDWLEWHPASRPASHVGGLLERREMSQASLLADDWHLVRYRDAR